VTHVTEKLPVSVQADADSTLKRWTMTKTFRDVTRSVSASLAKLRSDIPDTMKGFRALGHAALQDGALDKKTKELIALALGVAGHCDACIGFHVEALVKLGATRAEFEEALGVAVYMGGGPSLMYAADALVAWEEFAVPHEQAPAEK
jgi:AhpD family alkylhydroperoxidase